jgi:plastocyanin
MKRRTLLSTIVALAAIVVTPAVASAGGGCHAEATKSDASGENGATVRMTEACFAATVTTVDPGTPVTFVNSDDGITHNIGGSQWGHFEDMYPGDTFTVSFDEAGIYPFSCSYHMGMSGAIVVGDGKGAGTGETISVQPLASAPAAVTRVDRDPGGVPPIGLVAIGVVGAGLGAALASTLRVAARSRS